MQESLTPSMSAAAQRLEMPDDNVMYDVSPPHAPMLGTRRPRNLREGTFANGVDARLHRIDLNRLDVYELDGGVEGIQQALTVLHAKRAGNLW